MTDPGSPSGWMFPSWGRHGGTCRRRGRSAGTRRREGGARWLRRAVGGYVLGRAGLRDASRARSARRPRSRTAAVEAIREMGVSVGERVSGVINVGIGHSIDIHALLDHELAAVERAGGRVVRDAGNTGSRDEGNGRRSGGGGYRTRRACYPSCPASVYFAAPDASRFLEQYGLKCCLDGVRSGGFFDHRKDEALGTDGTPRRT